MQKSITGLCGMVLFSTVAWAQGGNDLVQEKKGISVELTSADTLSGSSDFQLFEHGIWPHVHTNTKQTANLATSAHRAYTSKKRGKFRLSRAAVARRTIYLPTIRSAEQRHNLPVGLLDALIWQESRYNPMAVSSAGAGGLTQLMPGTASDLGVKNRFNPHANIDGGARYLRQMLNKFGKIHLALAAYNAGPGAVNRAKGIPKNGETPEYVRKVMGRWTESVR